MPSLEEAEALLRALLEATGMSMTQNSALTPTSAQRNRLDNVAVLQQRPGYELGSLQYRDDGWVEREVAQPGHELLNELKELYNDAISN